MKQRGRVFERAALALWLVAQTSAARAPAPPPAATLPAVSVVLSVKDVGPEMPWEFRLENTSATSVKIVDDTKLFWLEVSLPGKPKPQLCRLPEELFPKAATPKTTKELGPGESLVRHVDARFYCFDAGKQKILIPTAQVTPHYGWPGKTITKWKQGKRVEETLTADPPFAATPVDSDVLGPAKNIVGDPIILDGRYAAWSSGPDESDKPDDDGDKPALDMMRGSDAKDEMAATATVRVKNPGRSRLTVFVRRELLTFEVLTPRGTMTCASEPDARNPERRAFTTLTSRNSLMLVSRLVEFCPRGTFGIPGLYLVKAKLDADVDGSEYGIDAFTGSLTADKPVPIRIRRAIRIVPNHKMLQGAPGSGSPQPMQMPGSPPQMPSPAPQQQDTAPPPPPPPSPEPAPPAPS